MHVQFNPKKPTPTIHTRNPYVIKHPPISKPEQSSTVLDGYKVLKVTGCELPDEVVKLNISGKGYNDINTDELEYFENLNACIANYNKLNMSIFNIFPYLQKLCLSSNEITYIDMPKQGLENLEYLDLSSNRIANIENLASLPKLKHLDLSNNGISQLRIEIGRVKSLECLNLGFNNLSEQDYSFWDTLSQLHNLVDLKINNNKFQSIQEPTRTMSKFTLNTLDISGNLFRETADLLSLSECKGLKTLIMVDSRYMRQVGEFLTIIKNKLGTTVIVKKKSKNEDRNEFKIKMDYRKFKLKKVNSENKDLRNVELKKDFFGIVIKSHEDAGMESESVIDENNKANDFFLTAAKEEKPQTSDKLLFGNVFDPTTIKLKDFQMLAQLYYEGYNLKNGKTLTSSYHYLNHYFS